jgi:ubiquinone/menaquinone biosynthesis C-methylase UbiE
MATYEELKQQQRRQWSGNAANWDSQHDRLQQEMAAVTEWLCREAHIAPGMRVLDLASGSGHPALDEARLVQPGGTVVATDLVAEMVEAIVRRAREASLDNLDARVMDAEAIEFPDESFDAVTCRFGIMFCPEPQMALSEVRRVLKPDAWFAFSVWDEPAKSPAQTVMGEALGRLGRQQSPVDYDAPGIYQLAPAGKLEALLREAGFSEIHVESLALDFEYESFEALWERTMLRPGQTRAQVEALSEEDLRRLKDELAAIVGPFTKRGVIHLPVTPLCAAARK